MKPKRKERALKATSMMLYFLGDSRCLGSEGELVCAFDAGIKTRIIYHSKGSRVWHDK